MMVIDNKYDIADIVYLLTDEEQKKRVVTKISILPEDRLLYELSCGSNASEHYEFEITEEKNIAANV